MSQPPAACHYRAFINFVRICGWRRHKARLLCRGPGLRSSFFEMVTPLRLATGEESM